MTDPAQSGARFTRIGVTAVPERAAVVRQEFSDWLHQELSVDATKARDIVLAVNEALANAAEFAYLDATPGVMHLEADHDRRLETLTVAISDEGSWRIKDPGIANPARGRGIPLMHALADRADIDPDPAGTRVRLQWDHIGALTGGRSDVTTAAAGPPERRTHRSAEPHS